MHYLPTITLFLMKNHEKKISKSDFLCKIAEEMINDEEYAAEIQQEEERNRRTSICRQVGHLLCTMELYSGKWDGEKFRPNKKSISEVYLQF